MTFYSTKTVLNDGTILEDKGLYIDGLDHATSCVKNAIANNQNIKAMILLPDNKGSNITITRNDLNK